MLKIQYVYLTVGTTWLGESDAPHASGHQTWVVLPKPCLGRKTDPAKERWEMGVVRPKQSVLEIAIPAESDGLWESIQPHARMLFGARDKLSRERCEMWVVQQGESFDRCIKQTLRIAIPRRIRQPVGKHTTTCREDVWGVRQAQQRMM